MKGRKAGALILAYRQRREFLNRFVAFSWKKDRDDLKPWFSFRDQHALVVRFREGKKHWENFPDTHDHDFLSKALIGPSVAIPENNPW